MLRRTARRPRALAQFQRNWVEARARLKREAEPSHGENRGSSPLGSANDFNELAYYWPGWDRDVRQKYGIQFPKTGCSAPAVPFSNVLTTPAKVACRIARSGEAPIRGLRVDPGVLGRSGSLG